MDIWRRVSRTLLLAIATFLAVGCVARADLIRHDVTARDLDAVVDSEPARALLLDLLRRRSLDPTLAARVSGTLLPDALPESGTDARAHGDSLPEQARLRELSREISLDFAALSFARAMSADRLSRTVQASFDRFLRDGMARSEEALREPEAFPYTVLFAPSWLYRSHPETGADFACQRRLLDRLGIANALIPTGESASVEDNAAAIAAAVRAANRGPHRLVIVSASKSGGETALALSRLLAPSETAPVVAWVNMVGALRGSPLADSALRPPVSWFARSVFWLNGWDWAGVASMATAPSRERLRGARLPESIAAINVVAVPLSGSVSAKVYFGYQLLRDDGPNDGVVPLADTVWPGGINLVAIGPDHLFAPREDDAHSLALMRAISVAVQAHRMARNEG